MNSDLTNSLSTSGCSRARSIAKENVNCIELADNHVFLIRNLGRLPNSWGLESQLFIT